MNIDATQAAQSANYAGQAMNAFQTAVNIDNQQAKPEGTTFWFRWLIRIVAIVTGIRNLFYFILFLFFFFFFYKTKILFFFFIIFSSSSCNDLWSFGRS